MKVLLSSLDREFSSIDRRSRELIAKLPSELVFERPREIPNSMGMFSCGEYLLRSAAMVEKTFGGITTRLWDDPFEWTLPEKLASKQEILRYMDDVEATRERGFGFFVSDADLKSELPSPVKIRSLFEVLLECIGSAEHYQGRAFAVFQMLSDERLPRL